MDTDSNWDEDFVLELSVERDDFVDENENYKHENTSTEEPVNHSKSAELGMDKKLPKNLSIKSEIKCEPDVSQKHNALKRQTTLSEYFTALPLGSDTPVTLPSDNYLDKKVNVSLLLSQLFNARVVLDRLPDDKISNKVGSPTACKIGSVRRYCYTCKTFMIDYQNLMSAKRCSKCDSHLLYVCDRCNVSHYHWYKGLRRHKIVCNGEMTSKSLKNVKMLFCEQCPYKTSYKNSMRSHVKCTGHKYGYSRELHELEVLSTEITKPTEKLPSQFIVKQTNIDFTNVKKRYCPKCRERTQKSSAKDSDTCDTCDTILLYQCTKCNKNYKSYKSYYRHLRSKCYPHIYGCPKCTFTTKYWDNLRGHMIRKSCKYSSKSSSYSQKNIKLGSFVCDHCSNTFNCKNNLKDHLENCYRN